MFFLEILSWLSLHSGKQETGDLNQQSPPRVHTSVTWPQSPNTTGGTHSCWRTNCQQSTFFEKKFIWTNHQSIWISLAQFVFTFKYRTDCHKACARMSSSEIFGENFAFCKHLTMLISLKKNPNVHQITWNRGKTTKICVG